MSRKFIFALSSRYPTEKAYGVTVGRTAEALRVVGNEVEICSPKTSDLSVDFLGNQIRKFPKGFVSKLLLKYSDRSRNCNVIWQVYFGLRVGLRYRKQDVYLCFRDTYSALLSNLCNIRSMHILELHHFPNGTKKRILQFLATRKNFRLVFISEDLKIRCAKLFDVGDAAVIQMAVPSEFLIDSLETRKKGTKNSIIFVGKEQSNGNDNGLLKFIDLLSK